MNTKSILLPSLALAGVCMGFSLTSCDEETREQLIGTIIGDAIDYLNRDSVHYLLGAWVQTYNDGAVDSLYFYENGTWKMRSISDTLDFSQHGTYHLYFKEKNLVRESKYLYNYKTKKEVPYELTMVDKVSIWKVSALNIYKLTLRPYGEDLTLSEESYDYQAVTNN